MHPTPLLLFFISLPAFAKKYTKTAHIPKEYADLLPYERHMTLRERKVLSEIVFENNGTFENEQEFIDEILAESPSFGEKLKRLHVKVEVAEKMEEMGPDAKAFVNKTMESMTKLHSLYGSGYKPTIDDEEGPVKVAIQMFGEYNALSNRSKTEINVLFPNIKALFSSRPLKHILEKEYALQMQDEENE